MPMRWEDTAQLYTQHQAVAVFVDPIDGPALTRELLKHHPDMVVIGCGVELDPASPMTDPQPPAALEKALLDAGARATAPLSMRSPAPPLKKALKKAVR